MQAKELVPPQVTLRVKERSRIFRENYFPSAGSFLPPPQLSNMQNSAMPLGLRPLDTED